MIISKEEIFLTDHSHFGSVYQEEGGEKRVPICHFWQWCILQHSKNKFYVYFNVS